MDTDEDTDPGQAFYTPAAHGASSTPPLRAANSAPFRGRPAGCHSRIESNVDCGSGLPRLDEERQVAVVPFGSLDDDPGRGADDHIFVASKSSWYPITDNLPQFKGAPQ